MIRCCMQLKVMLQDGCTGLLWACENDYLAIAKAIVACGRADVNIQDKVSTARSAMHFVDYCFSKEILHSCGLARPIMVL